jgi:scyllo-inositol 2-dehydrogenase (NADP+)
MYPYVEVERSLDEMLLDEAIELVVITSPNRTHFDAARKVLESGRHVVVEKPFVTTSRDADLLIDLAASQRRILTVYQNRRWDGDFRTVRRIVGEKVLGDIVEFTSTFMRYRNYVKEGSWKESPDEPGSGILYDLAPHLIDQALVLFGRPESVCADLRIQRPDSRVIDCFNIELGYPGVRVTLQAGMLVREPSPRFRLNGVRGSYVKYGLDPQEDQLKEAGYNPSGWGTEPEGQWGVINTEVGGLQVRGRVETLPGNYMAFYDALYDAVRRGQAPPVDVRDARDGIRVIELAMKSAEEGCRLPFGG